MCTHDEWVCAVAVVFLSCSHSLCSTVDVSLLGWHSFCFFDNKYLWSLLRKSSGQTDSENVIACLRAAEGKGKCVSLIHFLCRPYLGNKCHYTLLLLLLADVNWNSQTQKESYLNWISASNFTVQTSVRKWLHKVLLFLHALSHMNLPNFKKENWWVIRWSKGLILEAEINTTASWIVSICCLMMQPTLKGIPEREARGFKLDSSRRYHDIAVCCVQASFCQKHDRCFTCL